MEHTNVIVHHLQKGSTFNIHCLYQYDYGQRLVFKGVNLPFSYEVHFSNEETGESKTVIGDETGVDIPDEFLLSGEPLLFWIYLHDGPDDGETEYRGKITVIKRAKPVDIEPTPVQQDVITQTIAQLDAAVSHVDSAVEGISDTIDAALQEAKDSGEFDGLSPTAVVSKSGSVSTLSVTDREGTTTTEISDGLPGVDGFSPVATVTKTGGTATITITDRNGTTTATVSDGGAAGVIDDTAGTGATDKTWSANKLTSDLSDKADKTDTILNTTLSRGRLNNSTVGNGSFAFGNNVTASGIYSHAEGDTTTASSYHAHAEGYGTTASGYQTHAEGFGTTASGAQSHAEGVNTKASGDYAHAEGYRSINNTIRVVDNVNYEIGATRAASHAEGYETIAYGLYSHAEGNVTNAIGSDSHTEGYGTTASASQSHAEGNATKASGSSSHAEGNLSQATASCAHAEGSMTIASNVCSHSEGSVTTASGQYCHAEGTSTVASGAGSHAEGENAVAAGEASHAEGYRTKTGTYKRTIDNIEYNVAASGKASHIEGYDTLTAGDYAHAEGTATSAIGNYSHAEGNSTIASGQMAHAEGVATKATSAYAHAEGNGTLASGSQSHAEGLTTQATDSSAHAEGANTKATGQYAHAEGYGGTFTYDGTTYTSVAAGVADHTEGYICLTATNQPGNHAEGYNTRATGGAAHSEGSTTLASGTQSHAEGFRTVASAYATHAEGYMTTASGADAHSEGYQTTASGSYTHAEGSNTSATQSYAHAEGIATVASGAASHAEGNNTEANGSYQHVSGMYNVLDSYDSFPEWVANTAYEVGDKVKREVTYSGGTATVGYACTQANSDSTFVQSHWLSYGMKYAEIIGNGLGINARSNARALDWDGNEYLKGDLYVLCYADSSGGSKVATENDISGKADKTDTILNTTLSRGRKENTTVGDKSIAFGTNVTASGPSSQAYGSNTIASGGNAHAEGYGGPFTISGTTYTSGATGEDSHSEGHLTSAEGWYSHSEGSNTVASGNGSHAEGGSAIASGNQSHAEGSLTVASGGESHAEGYKSNASGSTAHAEGRETISSGTNSHAEGYSATSSGTASHAEGYSTQATMEAAHSEGRSSKATGKYAHAENYLTTASGESSHAEGDQTTASGKRSHVEGYRTTAYGVNSHVIGMYNVDDNYDTWPEWVSGTSYIVGDKVKRTTTNNDVTTITGYICKTANSDASFTSSKWTDQEGRTSYVEIIGIGTGNSAKANGRALDWSGNEYLKGNLYVGCNSNSTGGTRVASIADIPDVSTKAERNNTILTGSLSLGRKDNTPIGNSSIALGYNATASSAYTFAANRNTVAGGSSSSAFGEGTVAASGSSFVVGRSNVLDAPAYVEGASYSRNDTVTYNNKLYYAYDDIASATGTPETSGQWYHGVKNLFTVGNGNNDNARSNAFQIDLSGNAHVKGDVYVGCNADSSGGSKLIAIPEPPTTDGNYILKCVVSGGVPTMSWVSE